MIPAGVVRIIWAIAPNPEFRDAMLGDFNEEYEDRLRRNGRARAHAQCWRDAVYSLGGALYRGTPSRDELFTTILPAVLWGYLVTVCVSTAATMLLVPAAQHWIPVPWSNVWTVSFGPMALATAMLAGYEAARVGRRSPLWSSFVLGLVIAAVGVRAVSLVWLFPVLVPLAPVFCVAGAVVQQAQSHRLGSGITKFA